MKLVLSGYYGFGNAGDEAVLAAMVDHLRRAAPECRPIALSARPEETRRAHGVEAAHRLRPGAVVRALRGANLLVSGGGSLLQDVTSWRTIPYYLAVIALARKMGVPAFLYAHGVGPIRRPAYRRLVRRVVSAAAAITVRDPESARELASLGIPAERVSVTADPSLALGLEAAAAGELWRAFWKRHGGEPVRPVIGVACRAWGAPGDPAECAEVLAAGLRPVQQRLAGTVLLLPLHPAADLALARAVQARLGAGAAVWEGEVPPRAWPALFAHLDAAVTVRLHGLLFAARAGVAAVPVAYDPKVAAQAASLGLGRSLAAGALTGEKLAAAVLETWDRRLEIARQMQAQATALGAEAARTAELALQVARAGGKAQ